MKLKGEKNYIAWKEVIEDIAVVNGLRQYIYKKEKHLSMWMSLMRKLIK